LVRLLERAGQDGHTGLPRAIVDTAWVDGKPVRDGLEASVAEGSVVADDGWVALESISVAESSVADELLGLAAEDRLVVVLTRSPEPVAADDAIVLARADRLSLPELAAALQAVPSDHRVIVTGDPDELGGPEPGAALRDLIESGLVPVDDRRGGGGAGATALAAFVDAIRTGLLPEPDASDRSLVVVPCDDDAGAVRRVLQLVHESIPRVFGVAADDILVLGPLRRGVCGMAVLAEALPGTEVGTVHESAGRQAPAVVACLPGQAAGGFSRALLYSAAVAAQRHLSIVTPAGSEVAAAVADGSLRRRQTRLPSLLKSGAAGG
jgi:hypothetical protein